MNKGSQQAKEFIRKVIKIRRNIIRSNKSLRPAGKLYSDLRLVETWMDAHQLATEEQVLKFIYRESSAIAGLIPGKDWSAHDLYYRKLMSLIEEGKRISSKQ